MGSRGWEPFFLSNLIASCTSARDLTERCGTIWRCTGTEGRRAASTRELFWCAVHGTQNGHAHYCRRKGEKSSCEGLLQPAEQSLCSASLRRWVVHPAQLLSVSISKSLVQHLPPLSQVRHSSSNACQQIGRSLSKLFANFLSHGKWLCLRGLSNTSSVSIPTPACCFSALPWRSRWLLTRRIPSRFWSGTSAHLEVCTRQSRDLLMLAFPHLDSRTYKQLNLAHQGSWFVYYTSLQALSDALTNGMCGKRIRN